MRRNTFPSLARFYVVPICLLSSTLLGNLMCRHLLSLHLNIIYKAAILDMSGASKFMTLFLSLSNRMNNHRSTIQINLADINNKCKDRDDDDYGIILEKK